MDNDALTQLRIMAVESAGANRISSDVPAIVLEKDQHVESLEAFNANRSRMRGTYSTESINDFAAYVVKVGGLPRCFIDPNGMTATAFFNMLDTEGHPGHCDYRAVLRPRALPAYAAMAEFADTLHSQRDMAEWLEDWADNIDADYSETSNADPHGVTRLIAAVRKVKIATTKESVQAESDFARNRSAMENIEASASVGLPRGIRFTCSPFDGFSERSFYLRLRVKPDADAVTFALRWSTRDRDVAKVTKAFCSLLVDRIGDGATVLTGTFTP